MPDVVVRFIGDVLEHAATIEGGDAYVWCYGTPTKIWWYYAPAGTAVNCLTCLANGPKGDWEPHPMGRIRFDLVEGRRIGVVDTETTPWPKRST